MISKKTIKQAAVCYWSNVDKAFIVESSMFQHTAGFGDTVDEAWQHYEQMLDSAYEDLARRNYKGFNKVGRPAKAGVDFHVQVRKETKRRIVELANTFDVSQGEAVDFLLFFYECKKNEHPEPLPISIGPAEFKQLVEEIRAVKRKVSTAMVKEASASTYSAGRRKPGKKS